MANTNHKMTSYLIESLAPLVFRSGKPFGSQSSAQDVIFPLPSAAAGLVRALAIGQGKLTVNNQPLDHNTIKTDENYQKILNTRSRGPFLVSFDDSVKQDEQTFDILVPKPANALYVENQLVRLSPKPFDGGEQGLCGSDLPNGLLPVQMEEYSQGKPQSGAMYWTLSDLLAWQQGENLTFEQIENNGLKQLPIDIRTHVAIDDDTLGSVDGKLFQTASFDLSHQRHDDYFKPETKEVWSSKRFGFMVQSEQELSIDLATFGGERRLSHFRQIPALDLYGNDKINQRWQHIQKNKGFSLTFLTPCIFAKGYLPAWIDENSMTGILPNTPVKVQLKAVAIDRWQGVSGWDSILWKPKATRKAVCAGSVYWFEILNPDQLTVDILQMLENWQWSDHQQDKNDGFGVALLSVWKA